MIPEVPEPVPLSQRYGPRWDAETKKYTLPSPLWEAGLLCDLCGNELMAPWWIEPRFSQHARKTSIVPASGGEVPVEQLEQVRASLCRLPACSSSLIVILSGESTIEFVVSS